MPRPRGLATVLTLRLLRLLRLQGLLPSMVDQDTAQPLNDLYTIGAPADSYYEYAHLPASQPAGRPAKDRTKLRFFVF